MPEQTELYQRAIFFRSQGDSVQEREYLARYLVLHPRDDEEAWARFLRIGQTQKPTDSESLYGRLCREFYFSPDFHYVAARWLLSEWEFEAAEGHAKRAVMLSPKTSENWLLRAAVWEKIAGLSGGTLEAMVWKNVAVMLMKAARLDPYAATTWQRLGTAYRKQGDLHNALRYYRKAAELGPQDAETLEGMGLTLLWMGSPECGEVFEKLVILDPDSLVAKGFYKTHAQ